MSGLRRFVKNTTARTLNQLSIEKLVGQLNGSANRPVIICYHRVVQDFKEAANHSMPSLLVSIDMFEKQLDWLARHYRMVSLDEVLLLKSGDGGVNKKPVASITFDDGYADFYWNAFPVLKRKGIPSSVFVVSDLVGTSTLQTHDELYLLLSQWLKGNRTAEDRLAPAILSIIKTTLQLYPEPYSAARHILAHYGQLEVQQVMAFMRKQVIVPDGLRQELAPLDWEMLRALTTLGVTVGSHTCTHALLPRHGQTAVNRELRESKALLERKLGVPVTHLAYPDGQFDERIAASAEAAGYSAAYAICTHQSRRHALHSIPRQVLWQNACVDESGEFSPAVLSCLINGVFQRAGECTQDHQRR